jgi:hypothetical protein
MRTKKRPERSAFSQITAQSSIDTHEAQAKEGEQGIELVRVTGDQIIDIRGQCLCWQTGGKVEHGEVKAQDVGAESTYRKEEKRDE